MLAIPAARAGPVFTESLLQGPCEEILFCDLDGDQCADIVFVSAGTVHVFFQSPPGRFPAQPDLTFTPADTHSVLWPARLGRPACSLLTADHDGVAEWIFRGRSSVPERRTIVSCTTVLPEGGASVTPMTLSARTSERMPLLLLPVDRDLQVWRHDGAWSRGDVLPDCLDVEVEAPIGQVGYTRKVRLDMTVGDVTGDGADDLIIRKESRGTLTYRVHVQGAGARFSAEPQVIYTDRESPQTWHSWLDVNRDGKVDLIRSTWLCEPWFLPGVRSGKVLVRVFIADAGGRLPVEPTHALRKNDWTPPLPIVDVDGDGFVDLALGYSPFDSRESFRKALTARELMHDVLLHFFRPAGGFLPEPDCRHSLALRIDDRLLFLVMTQGSVQDRFFSLMGDFDGDGDRDLLLRDSADHISVYPFISRREGFSRMAIVRLRHEGSLDRLLVEDLNCDGVSDLLLALPDRRGFKVFVSTGEP